MTAVELALLPVERREDRGARAGRRGCARAPFLAQLIALSRVSSSFGVEALERDVGRRALLA